MIYSKISIIDSLTTVGEIDSYEFRSDKNTNNSTSVAEFKFCKLASA
ncbi:MAG: hypothetical protein RRZ69_02650 [Clostridia bacterium]